jgi:hypothetical protein
MTPATTSGTSPASCAPAASPRLICMTTDRLPRYRVLTGPDDAAFCYRVSEALDLGYQLYGSPALTVNEGTTIVAQALLWPGDSPPPPSP